MAKVKGVTDEAIIAALMSTGTVQGAATACGISPRTIYDWEQDRNFIALYERAKADIIRQAVFSLNGKLGAAVDAVAEIMQDKDTNAAVRLQAAQTVLNFSSKFSERLRTEETTARDIENPPYLGIGL